MTTAEFLLARKLGTGSGGDVTVEQLNVSANGTYSESGKAYSPVIVDVPSITTESLNVTENGTYTAPSGKAYTPIVVDVPSEIPENSFQLKTASGSLVSFADGSDNPFSSLKINIDAVQSGSGDPSPSNIRPISGWSGMNVMVSGKNMWNSNWSDYNKPVNYYICPIKLKMGATYTINSSKVGETITDCIVGIVKDGDRYPAFVDMYQAVTALGNARGKNTFTVDATYTNPKLVIFCPDETTFNSIFANYNIQLEEGSTATDYVPYNPNSTTYPISWQTEAGEVYGGWLDVVSGVLTVDKAGVNLGTLDWTYYTSGTNPIFYASISDIKTYASGDIIKSFCSNYKNYGVSGGRSNLATNMPDQNFSVISNSQSFTIRDDNYTSASDFKIAMSGVQLVYELATPLTYQLTPTLVKSLIEYNNLWADTGDVREAKYFSPLGEE